MSHPVVKDPPNASEIHGRLSGGQGPLQLLWWSLVEGQQPDNGICGSFSLGRSQLENIQALDNYCWCSEKFHCISSQETLTRFMQALKILFGQLECFLPLCKWLHTI